MVVFLFSAFTSGLGPCQGCMRWACVGRVSVSSINEGAHATHRDVKSNSTQCSKKRIKLEGPAHHLLTEDLL